MSINLLPWRERKIKLRLQYLVLRLSASAFLAITISITMNLFLERNTLHLENKIKLIKKSIQKITLKEPNQKNSIFLEKIKKLNSQQPNAISQNRLILKNLSLLIYSLPSDIVFSELSINKNKIQIQGTSHSLSSIQQYTQSLQKISSWSEARSSDIKTDPNTPNLFQFSVQVVL